MDKEKHMVDKLKPCLMSVLIMLAIWVVGRAAPCLAASLTITPSNSTWTIGTVGASTLWTSDSSPNTWTVTNDSAGIENISVKWSVTSPPGSAWTSGESSASSRFVLTALPSTGGSQLVTSSATTLFSGVIAGTSKRFGMTFKGPSAGEGGPHTLAITLTAFVSCGGYYNIYCWYAAGGGSSCTSACTNHGGPAFTSAIIPVDLALAALGAVYGGHLRDNYFSLECPTAAPYRKCQGNPSVCDPLYDEWYYYGPDFYGNYGTNTTIDTATCWPANYRACPCLN